MRRVLLLSCCLLPLLCAAQTARNASRHTTPAAAATTVYEAYVDSLAATKATFDSLRAHDQQLRDLLFPAVDPSARYMRLFTPLVYHRDVARRQLLSASDSSALYVCPTIVDRTLLHTYIYSPQYVVRSRRGETTGGGTPLWHTAEQIPLPALSETFDDVPPVAEKDFEAIDLVIKKPNFWTLKGDLYLQVMQNYYSSNWYQGMESNVSWLGKVSLEANYNNKQKVTWDNKLEMNLGFQTDRSDELHKLKTSEDLLRYTTKVGLQATKHWYYTFQFIANTQFMNTYESNSDNLTSSFFGPLNINASLGMTYNFSCCKERLTGSVYLSPIAVNYKFVEHSTLADLNGIDVGKHSLWDFGSTFTIEGTWAFNNIISWTTRLYGYTSYDRLELQWENTFDVKVSRIIALTLYAYPRFDDSSSSLKDKGYGYFQLKEYVSFGLTYSF